MSKSKNESRAPSGRVRIIAGKWRGRTLKVLEHPGLRPTPDRVRETLFNWLGMNVVGARCLDLFAGTGALGFEALSRGAKAVVFVDKFPPAIKALHESAITFNALPCCEIVRESAVSYLEKIKNKDQVFDIIFLDPPFATPLLAQSMSLLATSKLVGPHTLIYLESPRPLTAEDLPAHWQVLKEKVAGEVAYHLVQGQSA